MVDYGSGNRTRFRYLALTTSAVQTINDATGVVIRNMATSWTGEHLADWSPDGSGLRIWGRNAHHDITWTANATGTVAGSVRYDPWGTPTTITNPSSLPDFRFQGSWADDTTKLSWVVTRWYAPAQGRFISEDSLLGQPREPDSRHLYAYAEGGPIGGWDPDGRFLDTIVDIAFMVVDVWEIVNHPTDGWAWAALAGDAIGALIPFGSGGGAAVRGFRIAMSNGTEVIKTGRTAIRAVQKDARGRVIQAGAVVTQQTLGTGTRTTLAAQIRAKMLGGAKYEAGHIIARLLGGPGGIRSDNIVPILSRLNQNEMKGVEQWVAREVRAGRIMEVRVTLGYKGPSLVPEQIIYQVREQGRRQWTTKGDWDNTLR